MISCVSKFFCYTALCKEDESMGPDVVGENVKRLRQQQGMSQRQLAKAANVSSAIISQIESGKRPGAHIQLAVASRLAFVLHVSVDALTGGPLEMDQAA
jgi:transcriptional regulator with XRE-family HTH domain